MKSTRLLAYYWRWITKPFPNREELQYVGFLDESKTPEKESLARCQLWTYCWIKARGMRCIRLPFQHYFWINFIRSFWCNNCEWRVGETTKTLHFKYSNWSMENHFHECRLLIVRYKSAGGDMSATLVALAALRTSSDMPELNQLAKKIR